jgi:hypothetical protein
VKLRIHEDSLRLRLNRSDVEQFRETHPHGIARLWLGFGADIHAGNHFAVDSDGGPVSPRLHLRSVADGHGPGMGGLRPDLAFPQSRRRWRSLSVDREGFSVSSPRRDEPERRCGCFCESLSGRSARSTLVTNNPIRRRGLSSVLSSCLVGARSPHLSVDRLHTRHHRTRWF